jgi:anti-sigma factor RsiW
MTCRELIAFLERYRDGELSERQRSTFDAHLAVCPDCVHYLDSYDKTVQLSRDAFDPAEIPEDLVRAILDARSK